ncbi:MAG TPA: acetoin utilization protein AcuC, partial [Bdellovibrionota bacterium]|nr:acetoin utilization protein AcuC [Bdellovibrionota bacterium]
MAHSVKLVDVRSIPQYNFGSDHPFAVYRQLPFFDLVQELHLFQDTELIHPLLASDHDLALAHDVEYVDFIKEISKPNPSSDLVRKAPNFGLGTGDCPIAIGLHEGGGTIAGGTLACMEEVLSGRAIHAFNSSGGLHHAMRRAASGFCIYNDLVIAIRKAKEGKGYRILYVDFDVHHGDGVERAFYDDPSVLTLSFHENPDFLFPGTGRISDLGEGKGKGFAVNVPLAPFTADESWLDAIRQILIPLAHDFRPDLIVSQHGCDTHREDPLAHFQMTTQGMLEAARITHTLAHELCDGRWVATGGGGYQPLRVLPRVWTLIWGEMSEERVPEEIPQAWIDRWEKKSLGKL